MAQCREGWHLENEPQREQSGSSSEDEEDEDAAEDGDRDHDSGHCASLTLLALER